MKNILAENMRRFGTKNLREDNYTQDQAETRLERMMNRVFQAVNKSQPVRENGTAKLNKEQTGFYALTVTKPLFASDDAAYDKVIDEAMHMAEFVMYSQN